MSVHFDAQRGKYVVRCRQDGRNRNRRFDNAADAIPHLHGFRSR
jgi:hypothetical protein